MKIELSDLMLVNRALAHDASPKEKAFFIDSDGNFRRYMKRQPTIMKASETKKDIEVSANKMLRSLPSVEAKRVRENYSGESSTRERHLKIVIELVTKFCSYEELEKYAPALLKIM